MLTHRACLTNVAQMLTATPASATDRVLAVAPFFHAVGFVVLAGRALFGGATLVTLPRFDVTGFLAALQDHRITQTVVVPPIVHAPIPDERAGQLPKAYVVPARQVAEPELIEFVAARVAPHKRIHQVAFVDAIPTSPSGKTLRRLLAAGGAGE